MIKDLIAFAAMTYFIIAFDSWATIIAALTH